MRAAFFQFKRGLVRWPVLGVLAFAGAAGLQAQSAFTWKYEPRSLGAAHRYGYAIWTVPLAKLSLDGATIPLRAEFCTDPRPHPSPSPLGRGWSVNFFSSALVEVDQDSMRWHRPDGRTFYFILERGNASARKRGANDPVVFTSQNDGWTATKVPRRRFITLNHRKSGAELIYEDGLLVRFSFGDPAKGAERYSISYNRARRPVRLTAFGSGRLIAEFVYDTAERAKALRVVGESRDPLVKPIEFEYKSATLNRFESGPYLSKIGDTALTPLNVSYQVEGTEANRIRFERLATGGTTSLVWEAKSGFIREDEGASYKIENPGLANGGRPAIDPKTKSQVTDYNWRPDEAKITRTDRAGQSEFRFYDRGRGILTVKGKSGTTTATSYLLTSGPMYGKVRKIEEIRDGKVIVRERNAYDELGRIIRKIDKDGSVFIWEYLDNGSSPQTMVSQDGDVVEEYFYQGGGLVKKLIYTQSGIEKYIYEHSPGGTHVKFFKDEIQVWQKQYSQSNKILWYRETAGRYFIADAYGKLQLVDNE